MSRHIRRKTRRTRHELLRLKEQLELAQKARTLLEEKYRVLMQEAQHISSTILPFQDETASKIRRAYALLSEAVVSLGFRKVYRAALISNPNDEVEVRWTTIRGVSVPRLASRIPRRTLLQRGYVLTDTDYSLDVAARAFEEMMASLLEVAELENILRILKGEIEKTGIRVSALEKVLIPNLKNEKKIIEDRLEEKEREGQIILKWLKESQLETV